MKRVRIMKKEKRKRI